MFKIIPSFSYKLDLEGGAAELYNLKKRLIELGAKSISESETAIILKISSNNLAKAAYPFSNDLMIVAEQKNKKIEIEIIRSGEKNASLIFLVFVFILSIAMCVQDQNLKSIIFPIGLYIGIHLFSFIPAHPAHLKLKKLTRFLDEI
ncbi:MAG: hypothetical protein ACK4VO_13120 [Pseudobdellovibrio sp.]